MSFSFFRFAFLFFIFQTAVSVSAQIVDTVFFTRSNQISIRANAEFYVLRDSVQTINGEKRWLQKKYFMSHELAQVCPVIEVNQKFNKNIVQDGISRNYYKSGKLKGLFNKINGKSAGKFETYYEDGQLKEVGNFNGDNEIYIHHCYNKNGEDLLVKGTGFYNEQGEISGEEKFHYVQDSLIKYSFIIDQSFKDTIYLLSEVQLNLGNGYRKLYNQLAKVKVDPNTIKKYSRAVFILRFVLMEDGTLDRIIPISAVDETLSNLYIDCIRKHGKFKAQTLPNGQKVKVLLSIPIRLTAL